MDGECEAYDHELVEDLHGFSLELVLLVELLFSSVVLSFNPLKRSI